jgi:prevent-host-death family protein
MRTAGVAQVKARFSEYLAMVDSGEDVIITDRGRPRARIIPIEGATKDEARRMELARRGLLRLGKGKIPEGLWQRRSVGGISQDVLDRVMEEEREDRF